MATARRSAAACSPCSRKAPVELVPRRIIDRRSRQRAGHARERGIEQEAVIDRRSLMRDALKHTMGEARLPEIRAEFARRVEASELIEVSHREGAAGRTFTTREMQGYERELIERMKLSQGNREVLADGNGAAADYGAAFASELGGTPSIRCIRRSHRSDNGSGGRCRGPGRQLL